MMVITVNAVDIITMEECNMRLCTIIFPETSSSRIKEYTFKIPKMLYVKEGDILRNTNYQNSPMKVVRVFDYPVGVCNFYNGHLLKELLPCETSIETPSTRFNNNQTSNMEKRNITVSLEEAREWYNGENQILRKLALQAYTEKELNEPQTFRDVLKALGIQSLNIGMKVNGKEVSSVEIGNELTTHIKLMFIAKYFNSTWKPEMDKTKYFLGRSPYSYDIPNSAKLDNGYYIGIHARVKCPGIVYFQKEEDVRKAYEMLKDELR